MSELPEGYPVPSTETEAAAAPGGTHEHHVHAPAEAEPQEATAPPPPPPPQRLVLRVEPSVVRTFRDFFIALADGKEVIVVEHDGR